MTDKFFFYCKTERKLNMLRSLSSAIAGLRAHQTKMDVIGNNIANVNTNGYKSQRTTFSDVYYQTLSRGSAPYGNGGGTNPTQIGYGSQVATIDVLNTNGGGAYTGKPFDVYVDGDGFLTAKDANGATYYTRLGNLSWDAEGNLVDYMGNKVQGFKLHDDDDGYKKGKIDTSLNTVGGYYVDETTDLTEINIFGDVDLLPSGTAKLIDCLSSISIGSDGSITAIATKEFEIGTGPVTIGVNEPFHIGKLAVATFTNQDGLAHAGNSYMQVAPNSGTARYSPGGKNDAGITKAGYLEMSNVDLAQQFTDMITTQRGFQANTRIITVSDEMLQELVNIKR